MQGYNIIKITKNEFDKILQVDEQMILVNISSRTHKTRTKSNHSYKRNIFYSQTEDEIISREVEESIPTKSRSKRELQAEIDRLNKEIKNRKPIQKSVKTDKNAI